MAFSHLKESFVCGPDNIPSVIYRKCLDVLFNPLQNFFNLCLINMKFPDEWKLSRIKPIFKKGDKAVGENYRAISILSSMSKILEIILYNRLYNIFSKSVSPEQHGFVKGRSTTTNLISFMNFVSTELSKKNEVHVIYFDFLKAFDRVDHVLLITKLSSKFDIPPYLINLLKSYLTNRKSFVSINEVKSFCFSVLSGVPQGSHLGPLLFLMFINDLPSFLSLAFSLLFADDLKIFKSISSPADMIILQDNINNIITWSKRNVLPINDSKCRLMVYSTSKSRFEDVHYFVGDTKLSPQSEVCDLGVIFDSNLSFNNHIRSMVNDASRTLGFVIRSSHFFRDINTITLLYNTFVRTKLEYASTIWHGHTKDQTDSIEKVQKRFLRYLYYRKHGVYPHYSRHPVRTRDMLSEFNILSLQHRRDVADAVLLYRICNNLVDSPEILSLLNFHIPSRRTRQKKLFSNPTLSPSRIVSPINRIITLYNNLNDLLDLDIFTMSLNQFKKSVTEFLLHSETSI